MKKLITISLIFLTANTFAQQNKVDTSNLVLKGKLTEFQLMYKAVETPDDVTPNEKKRVLRFIESLKKEEVDTVKIKK